MDKLEIHYNQVVDPESGHVLSDTLNVHATLQAIIDRVNELSERADKRDSLCGYSTKPETKRFKAEWFLDQSDNGKYFLKAYFPTKAEAQAALEALLNL
jgi:hypothetical protein